MVDENFNRRRERPEYYLMFKTLEKAVKLDPYNSDAYYFLQAEFTWGLNRARDVNKILAYGMKYRTWDYWLPFYAGFNAAYFLKDYKAAAAYMERAAEISGSSFYTNLASRYFHQAGRNDLAVVFLREMVKKARTDTLRRTYAKRLAALEAVRAIEDARDRFQRKKGHLPTSVEQLLHSGFLKRLPSDPYGGRFYLGPGAEVKSTSNFSETPKNPKKGK